MSKFVLKHTWIFHNFLETIPGACLWTDNSTLILPQSASLAGVGSHLVCITRISSGFSSPGGALPRQNSTRIWLESWNLKTTGQSTSKNWTAWQVVTICVGYQPIMCQLLISNLILFFMFSFLYQISYWISEHCSLKFHSHCTRTHLTGLMDLKI